MFRKHLKEHPEIEKSNCNKESLGYMCRYCSNLYWTPEQRNTHQISDHQAEITKDIMICFICGAIFSSKVNTFFYFMLIFMLKNVYFSVSCENIQYRNIQISRKSDESYTDVQYVKWFIHV